MSAEQPNPRRSIAARAARARAKAEGRRWCRGDAWTREEEDWLRAKAGTVPMPELAAAYRRAFPGHARTEIALRVRCGRLGVSWFHRWWSLRDLESFFHVDHRAILRWWVRPGLLVGRRSPGRGPYAGWRFDLQDLERFIRGHGYAYDRARLAPRAVAAPLRAQAEHLVRVAQVARLADPWHPLAALAGYCCLDTHYLHKYVRRGLVAHRRAPGAGGLGQIRVRGREFPAIRAAIEAEAVAGRSMARRKAAERWRLLERTA